MPRCLDGINARDYLSDVRAILTATITGVFLVACAFAQDERPLDLARSRSHAGAEWESRGEFGKALGEYEKVLDAARAAVRSNEQHGTPGAREYFLLGFVEIDYARTLRRLQSGHMFSADYEDHLRSAVRSFDQSIDLGGRQKPFLAIAHEYLAVAHLLLGELKSAEEELRKAVKLDPDQKRALDALAELKGMSPGMRQAAATLVSTPAAVTLPQRQGLVEFGYGVAARIVDKLGVPQC